MASRCQLISSPSFSLPLLTQAKLVAANGICGSEDLGGLTRETHAQLRENERNAKGKGKANSRHEHLFCGVSSKLAVKCESRRSERFRNSCRSRVSLPGGSSSRGASIFPTRCAWPCAPLHRNGEQILNDNPERQPDVHVPFAAQASGHSSGRRRIASRSAPIGFLSLPACRNSDGPLHPDSLPRQSRVSMLKPGLQVLRTEIPLRQTTRTYYYIVRECRCLKATLQNGLEPPALI